jgi:glucose/arabinose dehydrogenase
MRQHRSPRRLIILATLAVMVLTLAIPLTSVRAAAPNVTLTQLRNDSGSYTQVTNADDGTNRLFLVDRSGIVYAVSPGGSRTTFMDIRSIVDDSSGERGLLGLAFHPDFATNHRLFVYYTRAGGDIIVARFTTNTAGTVVVASTRASILWIEHSARTNHNGGALAFGPDGYLYIGTGDGGGAGDPDRNAQYRTKNLLGKILRIDVNGTGSGAYDRYSIPPTNPYRGAIAGLDEIWAYGLRNPWRISFDRALGTLFIADVGQGRYEEINRQPAGSSGGRNYGWSVLEGRHCYRPASGCSLSGDTLPIAEYSHAGGNCSITGGYLYRGPAVALRHWYVFADFCSGKIWTMAQAGHFYLRRDTSWNITSFGEGEDGTLYFVTIDGRLVRVGAS